MIQRCSACFCLNDYNSREASCVSEVLKQLHLQQLINIPTNRRLTIFHNAINKHLFLQVNNLLQPVQRLPRHLNNKAFNTIHASKNCYTFSYFPRTITYWNYLPYLTFLNHNILDKLWYMNNNTTSMRTQPWPYDSIRSVDQYISKTRQVNRRIGCKTFFNFHEYFRDRAATRNTTVDVVLVDITEFNIYYQNSRGRVRAERKWTTNTLLLSVQP